ncbi:MAG: ABC transporter substrate-binding protein [Clostridia bacterium]|nr:ABC transporter substrate-binding protein [Clostridia bacterium]
MRKRPISLFLLLICLACALISPAHAQEASYTVGICQFMQHESLDEATRGFKAALTDAFGAHVAFLDRNAYGDHTMCSSIVGDLIAKEVDLLLANSTTALQVTSNATADIPILGTAITDYHVALQLDDFDGTVGGNVSGTTDLVPAQEQADMIAELFPLAQTVGILYCSSEPNSQYQAETLQAALSSMGYACQAYLFIDSNDLSSATTTAASECDVLFIPTDNTVAANAELIANICLPEKVPVIAGEESTCLICGVATISIDYYALGYATGEMAVQILRDGADISSMPIERASGFDKMYNPSICEALGIRVPDGYSALDAG